MAGAVESELVDSNPVALPSRTKVRTKRAKNIEPLTVAQVADLARAMPARLSMAVLLGCWCAPRYGELSELRRQDVDLKEGVLKVSRGMVKVKGGYFVGDTKTDAGVRRVHVPPPLLPELKTHLDTYVDAGAEALLFPAPNGGHLHSSSFARLFQKAAAAAVIGRHGRAGPAAGAGRPGPRILPAADAACICRDRSACPSHRISAWPA